MILITKQEREKSAQKHLQNIQASIKRRLNTARAVKDEKLVKVLEEEGDILHLGRSSSKFGM
jgi:hypothetical protein